MPVIELNIQLFILLILCGILIVCFVNIDSLQTKNESSKIEALTVNNNDTIESFQTTTKPFNVNEIQSQQNIIGNIINYKKQLNALFAASFQGESRDDETQKIAYLNQLSLQTLPKSTADDIVVTYFYFKNGAPTETSSALDQLIDFILTEKQDRETDFFLKAEDGISVDILFKYNYKNDFDDVVEVDAILTELPSTTRKLTDAELKRYKTLKFDKCTIDYVEKNFIKLTLKKSKIIEYTPPEGASNVERISGPKEVMQEFNIFLKITDLDIKLSRTSNENKLELAIRDFIPYDSFIEYKVNMRIGDNVIYTNYLTWQMYIKNASTDKVNANDFLREKLAIKQKELLHDKYNDIITPMFMVDNKISKLENSLNIIKDNYNFNKLNNMANNLRFYPVSQ